MEHRDGFFQGVRQHNIYYQYWLPEVEVKAAILIVHGLGEHSGRYMNVIDFLGPQGYAFYALDHIGHGKSDGTRMYVERFSDYTATLNAYLDMVRDWQPGKPIVLFGHSMGGLIAAAYLLDHQDAFAGAIISAPSVKLPANITPLTIWAAQALSRVLPKTGLTSVDANAVSSDPMVVQAYLDDPLVYKGKNTARLGAELIGAIRRVTAEASTIHLPVLLIQGSADKLVDPAGAQMLFDAISSADKTLRVYEGFYHEVCNEPGRDVALRDIGQWLAAQIS